MSRPPLGIVFFGDSSSLFSNSIFQPLYGAVRSTPGNFRLNGVVDTLKEGWVSTNPASVSPEDSFLQAAASLGAPQVPPEEEQLRPLQADLFIAAGYTQVVREPVLNLPPRGVVNFHASLLPAYRGKHPVFRALQAGERWAGLSVHVMDASLDTGPLLYQCRVRVKRRDSVEQLYLRIMNRGQPLMKRLLKDARNGTLEPYPQAREGASYFSSVDEKDFHIRFDQKASILERRICATPGKCFFEREGKKVYLEQVRRSSGKIRGPHTRGRITACRGPGFAVAVPGGSLLVQRVREEGEPTETGTGYMKRHGLHPGVFITPEGDGNDVSEGGCDG